MTKVTEDSFVAVLTMAGVAMPPVPAGVVRTLTGITFTSNDTAEEGEKEHFPSAKVTRAAVDYPVITEFPVKQTDGGRAGLASISKLRADDVLTLYGSADGYLTAWVSYQDRVVPA